MTLYIETDSTGNRFYYKDKGMQILHREDGPAVEWADGSKSWYLNGKRHRIDGPAYESADGDKSWWLNGERHRIDGPAIEGANGYKEWWLKGKEYTKAKFKAIVNKQK